jgi:hypothetical protein
VSQTPGVAGWPGGSAMEVVPQMLAASTRMRTSSSWRSGRGRSDAEIAGSVEDGAFRKGSG